MTRNIYQERYYQKNREEINRKNRERYQNDPEFRASRKRIQAKFRQTERGKEKQREDGRKYHQRHAVKLKNRERIFISNKRQNPRGRNCELCGREQNLNYHHWTDEHPEWGMWLCKSCHISVETFDRGYLDNYPELKEMIQNESSSNSPSSRS